MKIRDLLNLRTHYRVTADTLVIDLRRPGRVLSSAPQGGGLRSARYILNHQVKADAVLEGQRSAGENPRHPIWDDPARYLRGVANALGIENDCVGLMTAVPMKQLAIGHEESDGIWVECFATVGITNAVRAGEWPAVESDQRTITHFGTINLILVTN